MSLVSSTFPTRTRTPSFIFEDWTSQNASTLDGNLFVSLPEVLIEDLPNMEIKDADLVKHKEVLKGHMALKVSDSEYWVRALTMRYLDGKDFTTSYASKIDAVTADKVKQILASLSTTGRVEYIIEK